MTQTKNPDKPKRYKLERKVKRYGQSRKFTFHLVRGNIDSEGEKSIK